MFCRIDRSRGIDGENTARLPDRVTGHVLVGLKPDSRDDLVLLLYPDETIRIDLIFFLVPKQLLGLETFSLQALHLHLTYELKESLLIIIVGRIGLNARLRMEQRVKFLYINSFRKIPIGFFRLAIDQPLLGICSIACHA